MPKSQISANGIQPAAKPTDQLYPFDENTDPTTGRNFSQRLLAEHRTLYASTVVKLPPGKTQADKSLGELMADSDDITQLIRSSENNYPRFAQTYQTIAEEANQSIRKFSHSKALDSVAHRENPQAAEMLGKNLKQSGEDLKLKLDAIQQTELKALHEQYFDSDTGKPKTMRANPPSGETLIAADDVQKMYEKAEYELKVTHANQQALFANRFNNAIEQVRKLHDDAENIAAAVIMHNFVRPSRQTKTGYRTSTAQEMDEFHIHSAKEHQRIMRTNAKEKSGYNIALQRSVLHKFGGNSRIRNLYSNEKAIINIRATGQDELGNDTYSANCYVPAHWSSKNRLAALKGFVLECKAHGLKNFNILDAAPKLDLEHQLELIKNIREVHGSEAIIEGEREIIIKAYQKKGEKWTNKKLENPRYKEFSPMSSQRQVEQQNRYQEARHKDYLMNTTKVAGTYRGKIGPKTQISLPEPLEVPKASDITKPKWAVGDPSAKLTGKPLTSNNSNNPKSTDNRLASAKLSGKPKVNSSPAAAITNPPTGDSLDNPPKAEIRDQGQDRSFNV